MSVISSHLHTHEAGADWDITAGGISVYIRLAGQFHFDFFPFFLRSTGPDHKNITQKEGRKERNKKRGKGRKEQTYNSERKEIRREEKKKRNSEKKGRKERQKEKET